MPTKRVSLFSAENRIFTYRIIPFILAVASSVFFRANDCETIVFYQRGEDLGIPEIIKTGRSIRHNWKEA
jgi:hypothetical protein